MTDRKNIGFTEGNYDELILNKSAKLMKLNQQIIPAEQDLQIYLHEFFPYDEYRIRKLHQDRVGNNDQESSNDSSDASKKKETDSNDDGYGKEDDEDSQQGPKKIGIFNPDTGEYEPIKSGKSAKSTNNFVVRAFGILKLPDGAEHSISLDILGFRPYFYIKIPDTWKKDQLDGLILKLKTAAAADPKSTYSYANGLKAWEIYTGKPFYGFTADDTFQYAKLYFENSSAFKKYSRLLETLIHFKSKEWEQHGLFESNIEPMLRLMHIQEITPSGWIKVPAGKYRSQEYLSSDCEIHYEMNLGDVVPLPLCIDIPKLKVAAFDIESDSSHGDFPIADKNYRKLAQDIVTEFLRLPTDLIKNQRNSHHVKALIHTWVHLAFNPYYDNNNISKIVTKNDEVPSDEELNYMSEKVKEIGDQYHQTIMDIIHNGYEPNKVHGYREYYIGKLHIELEEHFPEFDMSRATSGNYQLLAEQLLKENHRMQVNHKYIYLKEPLETIKFWLSLAFHPYYDQHNISHVYNKINSTNEEEMDKKLDNLVPQIYAICMECYWELNKPKAKKAKSTTVIKPKMFMSTPPPEGQTKISNFIKKTPATATATTTTPNKSTTTPNKSSNATTTPNKSAANKSTSTPNKDKSGYQSKEQVAEQILTRGKYIKPRPVPYPDPDNPEKMKLDKTGRDFFVTWLHELFDNILPNVEGDPLIQIGTTFKRYGEKELYLKHIITLKGCSKFTNEQMVDDENKDIFITKPKDALAEAETLKFTSDTVKSIARRLKEADEKGIKKPEIPKEEIEQINRELYLARRDKQQSLDRSVLKVECYDTEAEVLLAWKRLIKEQDPDIITGYNIFGFDFKYMWDRARVLGIIEEFSDLGRVKYMPEELVEKKLVSSGLGDNLLHFISMTGRVIIDLLKVVQSGGYRLPIYKLDFVCNHFLYKRKNDLPPQELFILQKGSDDDRAKIARYCLVDCILCNRLLDKLEIVTNNVGMSRVCKIPLNYLFLRGQGIKIQSLVSEITQKAGYLIKTKERITNNNVTDDWFEGAIVLDPAKGIYFEPCVVADFNSLYPNCMIALNLSHDSFIELGSKYDNLPKDEYYDVKYDLYREEKIPGRKVIRRVKYGVKTCRYYQPKDGSKSMLPMILQKLLKARKSTREEQEAFKKGTFEWNVKEGLQLAYKVTANSLYGQVGARTSAISFKEIAACTTACGRDLIYKSRDFAETNYEGCKTVYGDSVTGDTPLLLRNTTTDHIEIRRIEDIIDKDNWDPYEAFKPENRQITDKQQGATLYQVWSDNGWTNIRRVIRHKTNKKIYRVNSYKGCVDVTEDHSLIDSKGEMIKPGDCKAQIHYDKNQQILERHNLDQITDLLYSFPDTFTSETSSNITEHDARNMGLNMANLNNNNNNKNNNGVPIEILNAPIQIRKSFFQGYYGRNKNEKDIEKDIIFSEKDFFFSCNGKLGAMGLYYLAKSIGYTNLGIYTYQDQSNIYWIHTLVDFEKISNKVRKIYELERTEQYVYDLETSLGRFQAGVGETVVSNTDSVFLKFDPKNSRNEKLYGLDAIYKSIELCTEAALGITRTLPKPHNLEFEKAIWPFMLMSKKRYHGHYYTKWGKCDFYPNSMGIVLKRRDNAKIVKHIFGGVLDIIMEEHDIKKAVEWCKGESKKLLEGKFPIEMFTITKTLKSYYKNPDQIAHNVLAQRIAERDPGNRVQSNDRMEFAYIKLPEPPKGIKILQGDKIETPEYIKTKDLPLDYRLYLTNQVMKPVTQIFELVLDEKELAGIFGEALMEYDRKASGFQRITQWVRKIPIYGHSDRDGDETEDDTISVGNMDDDDDFGSVPAYGIVNKILQQLKKETEDENAEPGHFEAKEGDEVLIF